MKTNDNREETLGLAKVVAVAIAFSTSSAYANSELQSSYQDGWHMPTAHLVQYEPQWTAQTGFELIRSVGSTDDIELIKSIESIQQLYVQKRIRHMEFVM